MIELIDFTKQYGNLTAVDDLCLKIEPGEMFGFIGPNGAGKSTTIRFLATLLKATSGDGEINGHRVSRDPLAVRRSIGYMPDSFGVYDGMRVWEFLDFFAAAYQIARERRKGVIGDVLELLDLTGKRDAYVNGLSRGMKQRLCLAKTLVHDPPVLILDEPASGLDPRARVEVKALLRELRTMGKTILISSHILAELADCCTSVGIIERGRLILTGPIDHVYRQIRRNRTLRLHVLEKEDVALSIIRNLPETRDVRHENAHIMMEMEAEDEQVAALLERLIAEGVRLSSFAEKEPTLEDVFMMVTKGDVA
jgi:ABC-2 type transport system ATP-binding protein